MAALARDEEIWTSGRQIAAEPLGTKVPGSFWQNRVVPADTRVSSSLGISYYIDRPSGSHYTRK
jgi:hypothetical protein